MLRIPRRFRLRLLVTYSFILLLSTVVLFACRATPTPPKRIYLRIGTADATQYIARELSDAFRREHPNTVFDFTTGNAASILNQYRRGDFDLAFISRPPQADELDRTKSQAIEFAQDGIFIVVNPANPLKAISREDLAKIFTGETFQWSSLNIPPPAGLDSIQVISREDGSGTRRVFEQKALTGRRVTLTALERPGNVDVLDYVGSHPNAIGYIAGNFWDTNTRAQPLSIDGIAPTRANIQSQKYPFLQTYLLLVEQKPWQDVSTFVDLLSANEGRDVIARRAAIYSPK